MIKIAFCDDDPHSLEMIRQRTEDFFRGVSEDASFFEFSSPENLVYEMEDGSLYDLLLQWICGGYIPDNQSGLTVSLLKLLEWIGIGKT